jgi:hypothetical protein
MSLESGADEVVIIEEEIETEPDTSTRSGRAPRIAAIVAGSVGLSVAASVLARRFAIRRQLATPRGQIGRMRMSRPITMPRLAIFAPSTTIALPFSQVIVPRPTRRLMPMGSFGRMRRMRRARR